VRITVRVRPGASRTLVGGSYGQPGPGEQPVLVVRVEQRAVDGAATAAVLRAVEEALGARRGAARLVSGVRSRTKVVEVDPAPENAAERLSALLGPAVAPD
jgi:uncharacterized protein